VHVLLDLREEDQERLGRAVDVGDDPVILLVPVPLLHIPFPGGMLGELLELCADEVSLVQKNDHGIEIYVGDGVMEPFVHECTSEILLELRVDVLPGLVEVESHGNEDPFVVPSPEELVVELRHDGLFRGFPFLEDLDLLEWLA